jgi:hypothetical protein
VKATGKTVQQIGQEADNARLSGYRSIQEMGPSSKGAVAAAKPTASPSVKPTVLTGGRSLEERDEAAAAAAKKSGPGVFVGTGGFAPSGPEAAVEGARAAAARRATAAQAKARLDQAEAARKAEAARQAQLQAQARAAAAAKAALARQQAERAAAARAAALAAAQRPKITGVGGGGAYTTTEFQQDRFQTTSGSLMPSSMNNSRWTTGY